MVLCGASMKAIGVVAIVLGVLQLLLMSMQKVILKKWEQGHY